jgi:hypothetical protein
MQPNFFIVGAPKAGTTSLDSYLDQHPQIYMSPIKEPSHFASELRPENFHPRFRPQIQSEMESLRQYLAGPMTEKRFGGPVVDWENYRRLFQNAREGQAIGEASASYLWSATAAGNISTRIPRAKIVMILRDPAERAYSQYLQAVSGGLVHRSFGEQVRLSLKDKNEPFDVLNPLLEFGLYYDQVKRYLQVFPAGNVKIYLYEDYKRNPKETLADLFRFLSVDPGFHPDMTRRMMEPHVPQFVKAAYFLKRYGLWQRVKRWSPRFLERPLRAAAFRKRANLALSPEDRQTLQAYYRDDILRLADLLNRDLGAWLS